MWQCTVDRNPGLSQPQPYWLGPLITLKLYHLVIAVDVDIEQMSVWTNERFFSFALCRPNEWSSERNKLCISFDK